MMTGNVRDTAEASYFHLIVNHKRRITANTTTLFCRSSLTMDPRRPRDPRLARDPRLQNLQPAQAQYTIQSTPSSSAFPQQQQQQPIAQLQWGANGDASGASTVVQPFVQTQPNASTANINTNHNTDIITPTPTTTTDVTTHGSEAPVPYKPRPLFCVVCASNQARNCISLPFVILY
jgi:RNA polymerase II subunit A C-terminal domain phosphatase SSU72